MNFKTSLFLAVAASFDNASVFISKKFLTAFTCFIEVTIPFSKLSFSNFISSTENITFNFCSKESISSIFSLFIYPNSTYDFTSKIGIFK